MRRGRNGLRYRLARHSVVWPRKGCLRGSIVKIFNGEGIPDVFDVFGVTAVVGVRLRLHARRRDEECTAQESGSQFERDHSLYERAMGQQKETPVCPRWILMDKRVPPFTVFIPRGQ